MSTGRSRIRHGSSRGDALVAAWNRSDLAYIVDQLAPAVTLDARHPKMSKPVADLEPTSKIAFAAGLAAYPAPLPTFEVVALFEDADTICFVLRDGDGDALSVIVGLDGAGKINRLTSHRPGGEGW